MRASEPYRERTWIRSDVPEAGAGRNRDGGAGLPRLGHAAVGHAGDVAAPFRVGGVADVELLEPGRVLDDDPVAGRRRGGVSGAVDNKAVGSILEAINPLVAERVEKLKVTEADLAAYGLDRPFMTLAVDQDREDAVRRLGL